MTFNNEGISLTHDEVVDWLKWYMAKQERGGVLEGDRNNLGAAILYFFESGPNYIGEQAHTTKCYQCMGKGHSNLVLLGSDKPQSCNACNGTGRQAKPSDPMDGKND